MLGGSHSNLQIVDLDSSHASLLQAFPSRRLGEPWTAVIDEALRTDIVPHPGRQFRGLGLLVDGQLRAVTIWRMPSLYGYPPPPSSWELCYLASHSSYPRRGYAYRPACRHSR